MKKRIIYIILAIAMLFAVVVPASAASSSENRTPIELSEKEVSTLDLSEFALIDSVTITAFLDENGNVVEVIEGDVPSVHNTITDSGTHYTAEVDFYESGGIYCVSITVTAKPSRWWIEKVKLSVLPKNGTDWMEREDTPGTKSNTHTVPAICWYYPDGSPENVTAEVKFYLHTAGEYALEDQFVWSGTATMVNP